MWGLLSVAGMEAFRGEGRGLSLRAGKGMGVGVCSSMDGQWDRKHNSCQCCVAMVQCVGKFDLGMSNDGENGVLKRVLRAHGYGPSDCA